jgi:YD repeat-containing protein
VIFCSERNGTIDQTVSYQYDKGGLRTMLTMPGSLSVTYTYDAKGHLVSLTDWSSQQTRYGYDNLGRLLVAERSNRLASQYQYDAAGRLRRLRHVRDNQTFADFAYTLDKRGNRTQAYECVVKAGTGATTLLHDNAAVEYYRGAWAMVGSLRETTAFTGALWLAFCGQEATLSLGKGPDHSIYDVYVDGN